MGMGSHQSARQKTDSWLTPADILQPLGEFDLDPCCPAHMPWFTAKEMWTNETAPIPEEMIGIAFPKKRDGLLRPWHGRVWLNPPWGNKATPWLERLAAHGNGIALIPARTETRSFFAHVWGRASCVCFVQGRPHFYRPDGIQANANCGVPVVLVAYGEENARILESCGLGVCVRWTNQNEGQIRVVV